MLKQYFLSVLMLLSAGAFAQTNILRQFEGKWIMQKGNKTIGEEWTKVSEAWFQSKGFFIKAGGDTAVTERVALKRVYGEIFYTSTVEDQNNKQPVKFKLTFYKKGKFIFENPQHDFPKRIIYHFTSKNTLHAYIDDGTKAKAEHFYYKKVKCSH